MARLALRVLLDEASFSSTPFLLFSYLLVTGTRFCDSRRLPPWRVPFFLRGSFSFIARALGAELVFLMVVSALSGAPPQTRSSLPPLSFRSMIPEHRTALRVCEAADAPLNV